MITALIVIQWRSYTRTEALVSFWVPGKSCEVNIYLNRNSIAVYRIMWCRLSSQCRLSTIFSFFSRQLQQQNLLWAPVASYAVSKPGSKFTLWSHVPTPTKCPGNRWTRDAPLDSSHEMWTRPLQRWREGRSTVADLEFWKGGFQFAIKARVMPLLEGPGGMPLGKSFRFLTFWDHFWCILGLKLQKLDDLLVVGFGVRRIKGMTPLRVAEAAYSCKARENKRSHTDSISPSLAAEGAMHE